jgi:hypothetical protein
VLFGCISMCGGAIGEVEWGVLWFEMARSSLSSSLGTYLFAFGSSGLITRGVLSTMALALF